MAYQSRRPRHRSKCPVYTRLMRSSNHPNKCRSCHGCTIDNKCNTFSQWADVVRAGIVERSQNRLKRKRRAVSETQAYDKPSTTLKPALRDEHIHKRARLQTCSISSGSFLGFSPVPSPERVQDHSVRTLQQWHWSEIPIIKLVLQKHVSFQELMEAIGYEVSAIHLSLQKLFTSMGLVRHTKNWWKHLVKRFLRYTYYCRSTLHQWDY